MLLLSKRGFRLTLVDWSARIGRPEIDSSEPSKPSKSELAVSKKATDELPSSGVSSATLFRRGKRRLEVLSDGPTEGPASPGDGVVASEAGLDALGNVEAEAVAEVAVKGPVPDAEASGGEVDPAAASPVTSSEKKKERGKAAKTLAAVNDEADFLLRRRG